MILTETLTCRIPSDNAIKLEKLYCTTNPTNYPTGLGDIATWVGVLLTATLAYFAFRAWKTSQSQLQITRDIAVNEQRVPALTDFLECVDRLLGRYPEITEDDRLDHSIKIVLRNHDRWTLTYPNIYKAGHLRECLNNVYELTCLYISFQRLNPQVMLDTQDAIDEFYRTTHEAGQSLDTHLKSLRDVCLDLHNAEIDPTYANDMFRSLSTAIKRDYDSANNVFPLWRIITTQTT